MPIIERLRFLVIHVGQKRDALEAILTPIGDHKAKQALADPLSAIGRVHHKIFQPSDAATLGGADGIEKADHPHHMPIALSDPKATDLRVPQNGFQPGFLFSENRFEIGFLLE